MAKKKLKKPVRTNVKKNINETSSSSSSSKYQNRFHLEFLNAAQKEAWSSFDQHDVLFLLGPAGCGKSHLACAFAINEILAKKKEKIILTRPIIEAGEALGFLPGSMDEKVHPYMLPMYDCISRTVGKEGPQREMVDRSLELAPLAYMRGRSLLNSEFVATPNGFKSMGDVKVGDVVIGLNGNWTKVVGVYPQGEIPYVKVTFSDGSRSLCSWDHLWNTLTTEDRLENKAPAVRSTQEIFETLLDENGNFNHEIPILTKPVQFLQKDVKLDPYLLGVLVATCSNFFNPKIGPVKHKVVKNCLSASEEISFTCLKNNQYKVFFGEVKNYLDSLNLMESKITDRFIPDVYKINSMECRLAVLQGIMDSIGVVGSEFSAFVLSETLADDLMFITRSLGGCAYKTKVRKKEKDGSYLAGFKVSFTLPLNPFKLKSNSKKAKTLENEMIPRTIVSIEPAGQGNCTCISVDSVDHLFVTNDFILTHNTFHDSVCIFDEAQNATRTQLKLFLTRFGQNSKVIITGDPKQSDLRVADQSLMDVVDKLKDLPGIGVIYFDATSIVRHPLIASIIERLEDKKS